MSDLDAEQPITSATRSVSCDGGGGALGHPRVFLNMGAEAEITCPYCSRQFVLAQGRDSQPAADH